MRTKRSAPAQLSLFCCMCDWLEDFLLPSMINPPICMIVTHRRSSRNFVIIHEASFSLLVFYLRAFGIYSNSGRQTYSQVQGRAPGEKQQSVCDQWTRESSDRLLVHCIYNDTSVWLCLCVRGPAAGDKEVINGRLVIILFQDCFCGSLAPGAIIEITLPFIISGAVRAQ